MRVGAWGTLAGNSPATDLKMADRDSTTEKPPGKRSESSSSEPSTGQSVFNVQFCLCFLQV